MVRERRKGIEGDGGGGADVDRRMAGDDDASAGGAMLGDRMFEPRLIFMVERAGRFVEQPDRRRRRDQTGEREPPALARGKPAARPVGNPVEGECGQRRVEQARRPARLRTPERCPERQGFARRQAGFDAILMADKVAAARDRRRSRPRPARCPREDGRRPARSVWRGHATGSSCRCRWLRSAAGRLLPAGETRARQRPGARRAGKRDPRRPDRVRSTALGGQKSGSGGGKPEPRGHGRIARPSTRFGGQTCKDEPYAYNMGSRLGLRFEKIVTIR